MTVNNNAKELLINLKFSFRSPKLIFLTFFHKGRKNILRKTYDCTSIHYIYKTKKIASVFAFNKFYNIFLFNLLRLLIIYKMHICHISTYIVLLYKMYSIFSL